MNYYDSNQFLIEREHNGFRILRYNSNKFSLYYLSFFDNAYEQRWCLFSLNDLELKRLRETNFDEKVIHGIIMRSGRPMAYLVDPET